MATWLQLLIALAIGIITFLQWRTAQAKLIGDLFERRVKIYEEMTWVAAQVIATGRFPNEVDIRLARVEHLARFNFGPEVLAYISSYRKDLIEKEMSEKDPTRKEDDEKYMARSKRLDGFFDEFDRRVEPYMLIDQKLPLWWWPKDWRIRLDEALARIRSGPDGKQQD
jgi:hypothetical protein